MENGKVTVSMACKRQPSDQISDDVPYGSYPRTSGAEYPSVPARMLRFVSLDFSARPKSASFATLCCFERMMFSSLMSR